MAPKESFKAGPLAIFGLPSSSELRADEMGLLRAVIVVCSLTAAGNTVAADEDTLGEEAARALPAPFATKSAEHHSKIIGWPAGKTPLAPPGFRVNEFAGDLDSPRWIYFLPNGDALIAHARTGAERSTWGKITLLRDADGNGEAEFRSTFLEDMNQPLGMVLVDGTLYVACTDAVIAYPYQAGQTKMVKPGMKILDLPAGGYNNHWTRNIIANEAGSKLYVSVGSASNVAEHGMAEEILRANILEVNRDGTGLRVFASGLRNPVGMDWEPLTGELWTAVNERDELGDDLVPDFMTSVKENGFYGWPYSYFGAHEDPRLKGARRDLVAKAIVPDVPLGSHTASLGLCFYTARSFPQKYHGGAFVGQHGSWNRSKFSGYRVVFVPFQDGEPAGEPQDFLAGFIANDTDVYGRPVCVAVARDGSLLVSDDAAGVIWRVSVGK